MNIAVLQNFSPSWHRVFTQCGLNVVFVWFNNKFPSPIHDHPGIAEALSSELKRIGVGWLDSSHYPGCYDADSTGSAWHIYHANDLAAAMNCLKAQLAARGLLGEVGIFHAEAHDRIVCWYSPRPEEIGQTLEG